MKKKMTTAIEKDHIEYMESKFGINAIHESLDILEIEAKRGVLRQFFAQHVIPKKMVKEKIYGGLILDPSMPKAYSGITFETTENGTYNLGVPVDVKRLADYLGIKTKARIKENGNVIRVSVISKYKHKINNKFRAIKANANMVEEINPETP